MEQRSLAMIQLREAQDRLDQARSSLHERNRASPAPQGPYNSSGVDTTSLSTTAAAFARTGGGPAIRSTLCIVTFFFESDPTLQYTFPIAAQPLWDRLRKKQRVGPQVFAPEALYREVVSGTPATVVPWLVISSTHIPEPLVCHAEELRSVMVLLSPDQPHCVVDWNGFSTSSDAFWAQWEYQSVLMQRAMSKQNFVDNPKWSAHRTAGGPWKATQSVGFPGELLRPR